MPLYFPGKSENGFPYHTPEFAGEMCIRDRPDTPVIEKPTFGSSELVSLLERLNEEEPIRSITLVGLCTDICVISNALLIKAYFPEIPIAVDATCLSLIHI